MLDAKSSFPSLLVLMFGVIAVGCEHDCPVGYRKVSGACYKMKDAGLEDATLHELDAANQPSLDSRPTGDDGGDTDSAANDARIEHPIECPKDACAGGTCVGALDGWSCDCPTGHTGTGTKECKKVDPCSTDGGTCQVDPCDPSPCGAAFICERTPTGTASCVATCATSELGCQLGEACSTDEECRTSGDENASCESADKVCVTVCPTTSIVSELNLEAAKYCLEIDGDLIVNPSFATIPAGALPYLKRIRGRFNADLVGVLNKDARSLTFSALQTIEGELIFWLFQNATLLSFPRLTSVGGNLSIVLSPALERLSLPQLATVHGNLKIARMPVSQLDIGRLQTVGGTIEVGSICNLPWSQVSHLEQLAANPLLAEIGCCTGQWTQHACSPGGGCMCD